MEHVRGQPEDRRGLIAAGLIYVLTTAQLAVATFVPGLPQFEGKAFGARLIAYPLLMAALPAVWWLVARRPPIAHLPNETLGTLGGIAAALIVARTARPAPDRS